MTAPETILEPPAFHWARLVDQVRAGNVVPVLGRELLEVPDGQGGRTTLDRWLAGRLGERLGLGGGRPEGMDEVLQRLAAARRDPADLYVEIDQLLSTTDFPVPPALEQLARIHAFRLFLSTTPDTLIDRALAAVREADGLPVLARSHALDAPLEPVLGAGWRGRQRVIYRLFGQHAPDLDRFAVTDEDALEFLHHLQTNSMAPAFENLFGALKESSLLLLGCGFPDWLILFLVRTLKNERLSSSRRLKAIVDRRARDEGEWVVFLSGVHAQIYRDGTAVDFVAELASRLGEATRAPAPPAQPHGHVFISYAREDSERVGRLVAALKAQHIPVWVDREHIASAQNWSRAVDEALESCSAFLACISRTTESRPKGEFFREWHLACKQSRKRRPTARFLWPLLLDPLEGKVPREVPPEFRVANIDAALRCYDGQPTPGLLEGLANEVRQFRTAS